MVSERILARLLGHPLSGRYQTTLKQYSPAHELSSLGMRECVGDPTSTRDEAFQWFINGRKPHLTNRFCKVELDLNSTSWYVDLIENFPSLSSLHTLLSFLSNRMCIRSPTIFVYHTNISLIQGIFQFHIPSLHSPISLTVLSFDSKRVYNLGK